MYINNTSNIDKLKSIFNQKLTLGQLTTLNLRLTFLGNNTIKSNNNLSIQYRELNLIVKGCLTKRINRSN